MHFVGFFVFIIENARSKKQNSIGKCLVSLLNLLILICYKRVINRTVFCEFSESIDFDLLQKSDK